MSEQQDMQDIHDIDTEESVDGNEENGTETVQTRGRKSMPEFPLETGVDEDGNSVFDPESKKLTGVPSNYDSSVYKVLSESDFANKGHFYLFEIDRFEEKISEWQTRIDEMTEDYPFLLRGEVPPREAERKAERQVSGRVDFLRKLAAETGNADLTAKLAEVEAELLKDMLGK